MRHQCPQCGNDKRNHKITCQIRAERIRERRRVRDRVEEPYKRPFFAPHPTAPGLKLLRLDLRKKFLEQTRTDLAAMLPLALSGESKCVEVRI